MSLARRHDPGQEGKRQVPLSVTNAVFSKLIKLGQAEKKTPAALAQALFEEAYAARCLGHGAGGQVAACEAEEAHQDLRELAAIAEGWKAKAERLAESVGKLSTELDQTEAEREELRTKRDEQMDGRARTLDELVACQDRLVAACNERDEARRELDELRRATVWAPAMPKPAESEPLAAAPGKGTVKAVLAMRGLGATPAEIAKELALRPDVVRQVLKEAGA